MKSIVPIAVVVFSTAILGSMTRVYAVDEAGITQSEFERYRSERELELSMEQTAHAELDAPQSPHQAHRQARRFELERFHQRQLLERQRRRVAASRVRLGTSPTAASPRGITIQRLQREQSSERLSRKLLR